ncbi:MAG: flagellar hook-length control protein FliK, partial [Burkholderiales bacterium]
DSGESARPGPPSPVAEDLAPMVRRQLDFIENPTLVWRGDIWPGQNASLEIRPEPAPVRGAASEPEAWTTLLRLKLAHLGDIEARINLRDQGLNQQTAGISLIGKDSSTAQIMAAARADLESALVAQGVRMDNFSVTTHE